MNGTRRCVGAFTMALGLALAPTAFAAPAIVNFNTNMILTGTATLEIEIGGFLPGAEHDQVNVAQTAILNGRLDIVGWNGFQILPGDVFTVLTFGTRLGDFTSMTFSGNTRAGLSVTRRFAASAMTIHGEAVPGDANLDARVDFDDLLLVAQFYDRTGRTWLEGDFTRDGTVSFDDLLLLAQHYDVGALGTGGEGTGTAFAADWQRARSLVPEPAAALLLSCVVAIPRRRLPA